MDRTYLKEENIILRNCQNFRHNTGSLFYATTWLNEMTGTQRPGKYMCKTAVCLLLYCILSYIMFFQR